MIEKTGIINTWTHDYKCNLDLLQVHRDTQVHLSLIVVLLLNISSRIMVLMFTREMVLQGGKTQVLPLGTSDLLVLILNKPVP